MKKISYLIILILAASTFSCAIFGGGTVHDDEETILLVKDGETHEVKVDEVYSLKGTDSEIMNAFKSVLSRYEFETFSQGSLTIVTKIAKLDETSPVYEEYKRAVDIFGQYKINMTRIDYDIIVEISYTILVQEMNMKTNQLGYKEVAREKKLEDDIFNKVKRLLYGS